MEQNETVGFSAVKRTGGEEMPSLCTGISGPVTALEDDMTVVELVTTQAARTPGAVAVVAGAETLSYAQLNAAANRLARGLRRRGIGAESRVGVFLERTAAMPVALLGILKAGAAYVPLDPIYPAERIAYVLEDAEAALLLTQQSLLSALGSTTTPVLCLDRDEQELAGEASENLACERDATALAYVIYTSGSTGRPKGVQIEHRALVNFLHSMQREPGMTAADRLLAVTTLSFDIAGLELFLPLISGARVILVPWQTTADGRALMRTIEEHEVTMMQATPATWRLLVEAGWAGRPGLKILCGGEPLPADLARQLLPRCAELWNMYGPTETTIWSTCCRVQEANNIHIGRPINNTELYILDEQRRPVPVGVAGELLIGGAGLARGYFKRPDLTAEKFIAHPFTPGARLYRTGDLARYRPDGNVDCLGRLDFQVKIRGFRIELGEIESCLAMHPDVKECVVTAWDDQTGEKRLVAYIVPQGRQDIDANQLREHLRSQVPDYMVPAGFIALEKLPRTPNGKTDRKALPQPTTETTHSVAVSTFAGTELEQSIAAIWREVLGLASVGLNTNFFDLGGHSLLVGRVQTKLSALLNRDIPIIDLYQHPTICKLAAYLSGNEVKLEGRPARVVSPAVTVHEPIAIVGMAARFPGANDLKQFWTNLASGVESISFFSDAELRAAGVPDELIADPAYVRAKSIVDKVDHFDASFFGYSPGEATLIDPQQRIFLEAAWSALEDAGYNPDRYAGSIGVYAGASPNLYMFQVLAGQSSNLSGYGFPMTIHQEKDYLATRVSYELNLRGPSVSIQTACSTSLVAVHMACRSLLGGECDMALAGAVSVQVPQNSGYLHQEGGIGSRDGHCRVFDAEASGTVFGNGVGVVALKRLSDALRDGDYIRAVIKSTAINNDGSGKVGFTAPSIEGQAEIIAAAHQLAHVHADQISYVEAHGTGTVVGDPIEITALTKAFRATTDRTGFCAVGSVKSNLGHLDAAAGMAGLIKTVLALEHRQIPPTLHFSTPNPNIDFVRGPFYVNTKLIEWKSQGPRLAGISSFGVGGTNSHVILEEAPERPAAHVPTTPKLLTFSGPTPSALENILANFREYLRENPTVDLNDAAFTLQAGRREFELRQTIVCQDSEEALHLLDPAKRPVHSRIGEAPLRIAFMFTGQGAQYSGMGTELYCQEPVYRTVVDECLELIRPHVNMDFHGMFLNEKSHSGNTTVNQTAFAQPSLFILEYALARLWMGWGVQPHVMIGHSIGEYVAACLAGVISLPDALRLVAKRGQLMQSLPGGSMLAVLASEQQVRAWAERSEWQGRHSIAAVNAPELTVVSGPSDEIQKFEAAVVAQGRSTRLLHTSHAFHSSMMDSILDEFTAAVGEATLRPPRIPYISNLTGTWLTDAQATDPSYYAKHLRQTVRFSDGIVEIAREVDPLFLEVGPGQTLASLVKRHMFEGRKPLILHSLPGVGDKQSDGRVLLGTLGSLWSRGQRVDWEVFYKDRQPRRIPLPTYPFERQRYSVETNASAEQQLTSLQGKRPIRDWFYAPGWKSSLPLAPHSVQTTGSGQVCLVFRSDHPFHEKLTERISKLGYRVFEVWAGQLFRCRGCNGFEITPAESADYSQLLEELARMGNYPNLVLHLWGLGRDVSGQGQDGGELPALDLEFFPLVFLAQAIGASGLTKQVDVKVLVNGSTEIVDEGVACPEHAVVLGPCIVIPQEYDNITCSCVDVDLRSTSSASEQGLLDQLAGELSQKSRDSLVALRGRYRWTRTYDPLTLAEQLEQPGNLKQYGRYLITGGLGGVGLELAEYLAKTVQAKLILLGRTSFPAREDWPEWLAEHESDHPVSRKIARLQQLESYGAEVLVYCADVADRWQMQAAVGNATERFGPIDGVIHAAGLPGGGAVQLKSRETAIDVLRAKVQGTHVLVEVLSNQHLDFLVLCSSVNAVIGGFGQVDYCAANAFLDAFVHYHKARTGVPTIAVNWDVWSDVGMAFETTVPKHLQEERASELKQGISAYEGQQVFARLLTCGLPQVLVSTREFSELQSRRGKIGSAIDVGEKKEAAIPSASHPRPDLTTAYIEPADEIERTVAGLWQQALGVQKIGVHDNFFELGGDSLLAIQVVAKIRQAMNIPLPVANFYAGPTIASLKNHLIPSQVGASETVALDARRQARQELGSRAQRRRKHGGTNCSDGKENL